MKASLVAASTSRQDKGMDECPCFVELRGVKGSGFEERTMGALGTAF